MLFRSVVNRNRGRTDFSLKARRSLRVNAVAE